MCHYTKCNNSKLFFSILLALFLFSSAIVASQTSVGSIPGYSGELPFKLETGYVGVGDSDELQLFYYFIESERSPALDPLLVWLTGGPGCSGLSGLFYEIGPLTFDYTSFNGSWASLVLNSHSWTKIANIIFVDAPVGTGFSYSETAEGYTTSDTLSANTTFHFIRKWLIEHPKFLTNPLYIAGDSYSGKMIPMIAYKIAEANKAQIYPILNLKGYIGGNPITSLHDDENSRVEYFFRVGLLSKELYNEAKTYCNGEYVYLDLGNAECTEAISKIAECTIKVNDAQILEPKCVFNTPKPKGVLAWGNKFFDDIPMDALSSETNWCRNKNYLLSYIWADDYSVRQALGVRNGTKEHWKRCNKTLDYDDDVINVVPYHKELMNMGYRALIYSGDHDMMIPYTGTKVWIKRLNISTADLWRPWFVEGQVAGFTERFSDTAEDGLTFATVKGGGHTAPEYKPRSCFQMVDRWLSYYYL